MPKNQEITMKLSILKKSLQRKKLKSYNLNKEKNKSNEDKNFIKKIKTENLSYLKYNAYNTFYYNTKKRYF